MALSTKEKKIACRLRGKLEQLSCPLIDGVDDSWVMELIFRPGAPRIRLLQWLFSKFDSRLNDLLDPQFASSDNKMDSRIQRLLFVASSLGFCGPNDAELIRGTSSVTKQTVFMQQLLDHVYIMDQSEDPQSKCMHSPGQVAALSVDEQFAHDCFLIDELSSNVQTNDMFKVNAKIFPPDIQKHLDNNKESNIIPELSDLMEQAEKLSRDLDKQKVILIEINQSHIYEKDDPQSSHRVHCTLKLVLSEISQLLSSFSSCFETEIRQWCNKEAPQLNQLGPAFKQIHKMLEQMTTVLQSLGQIKRSYTSLCGDLRDTIQKITSQEHQITRVASSRMPVTDMKCYQECVNVLEESQVRMDNTMNSTTQSGLTISTITPAD